MTVLRCDDGTIPDNSEFQRFSDKYGIACEAYGTPVDDPMRWKGLFKATGFKFVTQEVYKIPCGPWAKEKHLREVGNWEQLILWENLEGMVMRLFQKELGMSEAEIIVSLVAVRREIVYSKMHAYCP